MSATPFVNGQPLASGVVPGRYTLGPGFGFTVAAPAPTPPPTGKADVAITVIGVDQSANVLKIQVPAYDPAANNVLLQVVAFLVPAGATPPADAHGYITSSLASVAADLSGNIAALQASGGEIDIPLPTAPAIPAGQYVGQIILGFDA